MTDEANEIDQAERIRRLQERRAASARARRPDPATPEVGPTTRETAAARSTRPASTGPASTARRRRPHPAAGTRWLLGGLSVASFFTIAGTIAAANINAVNSAQPAAPTPAASVATPTAATAAAATPAATPRAATKATPVVQVPHTTTRGS